MADGIGAGSGATGRPGNPAGAGGDIPQVGRRQVLDQIGVVRADTGMGQALRGIGQAIDQVVDVELQRKARAATANAYNRGTGAVVRDGAGNLSVKLADPSTLSGEAFNRGAQAAYEAQFEADTRAAAARVAQEHELNPGGFLATWEGHARGTLAAVPQELRGRAALELETIGVQTHARLLSDQADRQSRMHQATTQLAIDRASLDMENLARAGKAGTPEYRDAAAKFDGLLSQGVAAQWWNEDEARIRREDRADMDAVQSLSHQAEGLYRSKGAQAARGWLDKQLDDPALRVPASVKNAARNDLSSRIADDMAIRRETLQAVQLETQDTIDRLRAGVNVPATEVASAAKRLRAAGDVKRADAVERIAATVRDVVSTARLPLPEIGQRMRELDRKMQDGTASVEEAGALDDLRGIVAKQAALFADDPLAAAAQKGAIPPVGELSWGEPDKLVEQLKERQTLASRVETREQVPALALRPAEVDRLKKLLNDGTADEKLYTLDRLRNGLGRDGYGKVVRALTDKGERGLAVVGAVALEDAAAARVILGGQGAAQLDPKLAPKDKQEWRDALSPMLAEAYGRDERLRAGIEEAVQWAYSGLAQSEQDLSGALDEDRLKRAVDIVTGGTVEFNGTALPPPRRGMTQDDFDVLIENLGARDLVGARYGDGSPVSPDTVRDEGELIATGAGRYAVLIQGRPVLAEDGSPFEMDLRNVQRLPGAPVAQQDPTQPPAAVAQSMVTPNLAGVKP